MGLGPKVAADEPLDKYMTKVERELVKRHSATTPSLVSAIQGIVQTRRNSLMAMDLDRKVEANIKLVQ